MRRLDAPVTAPGISAWTRGGFSNSAPRLTKKPKKALSFQRGGEFCAGAMHRLAPLTLQQPDNRIPDPRRHTIVGDVSKKSYFVSTTGAVSEQLIAKYINSQETRN